jgi:replicative DNA helicase
MSAPLRALPGGRADTFAPGRTPPHNLDAERGLVGIVMRDESPSSAALARQIGVRSGAFYEPALKVIWEAMEALVAEGSVPDLASVALKLGALGRLEEVGGYAYLMRISDSTATSLRLRQYAEEVKLLWERRHASRLVSEFWENCHDAAKAGERGEFVKLAGALGNKLVTLGRVQDTRTLADRVGDVLADVQARAEGKEDRTGWLFTGMPIFDKVCQPFGSSKEDHFIGIAGGSGQGKSAVMRQWAHAWNRAGKRVIVYTRETSIDGWIEQAAAQAVGVDLMNLRETPRDVLAKFYAELAWLRDEAVNRFLFVYENDPATSLLTVEDVVAHYRAFEHLHGKPDAVVVDYLQILSVDQKAKRCNSREQEVAHVSHTLQAECRRAGNVWVVGAQMNEQGLAAQRTLKKDDQGRIQHRLPLPGDLRESQAFYHDVDRMICIYRPPEDCTGRDQVTQPPAQPEQWLCQIKRRRGGTGSVKCWFQRKFTRFVEFTHAELRAAEAAAVASSQQKQVTQPGAVTKRDFKAGKPGPF